VTDRIDAGAQGIQAIGIYPNFDFPPREAEPKQLAPRDDPVLASSQPRDLALLRSRFAKPQESTYTGD
jgi:hypothetical protein